MAGAPKFWLWQSRGYCGSWAAKGGKPAEETVNPWLEPESESELSIILGVVVVVHYSLGFVSHLLDPYFILIYSIVYWQTLGYWSRLRVILINFPICDKNNNHHTSIHELLTMLFFSRGFTQYTSAWASSIARNPHWNFGTPTLAISVSPGADDTRPSPRWSKVHEISEGKFTARWQVFRNG